MRASNVSIKKLRFQLFLLGVFKIPMIGFIHPRLISIDDQSVTIKIKLRRKSKNHLNSMYFGALAVGADIAGGIHTFYYSEQSGGKISFSFKDMKADFLKRAESDVTFISDGGDIIKSMLEKSKNTGDRQNDHVKVIAYNENKEVVAEFLMGVSLKVI
jgi:acyl-coenzyme A thioesterase PaaI-like protein